MMRSKTIALAALAGLFTTGVALPSFAQTKTPQETPPCARAAPGQPAAVTGSSTPSTCADPNSGSANNANANGSGTGTSSGVAGAAPSTSGKGASGASGSQGGTAN